MVSTDLKPGTVLLYTFGYALKAVKCKGTEYSTAYTADNRVDYVTISTSPVFVEIVFVDKRDTIQPYLCYIPTHDAYYWPHKVNLYPL